MRRRLFSVAWVVSLAAGLLVAGLGVRGYWVRDSVECLRISREPDGAARASEVEMLSAGGGVAVIGSRHWVSAEWLRKNNANPTAADGYWWKRKAEPGQGNYPRLRFPAWTLAGFQAGRMTETLGAGQESRHVWVVFPVWVVVGLLMVMPAAAGWRLATRWALKRRAQRRVQRGLCGGCGYDLRGSAGVGRCPECGVVS